MTREGLQRYKERLLIFQEGIEATLSTLSQIIVSAAMLLGTVTVAAVPALFTGYSIYSLTSSLWGREMGLIAGWVFAVGLEAVGLVTANVALKLYRGWREQKVLKVEFDLSVMLMIVYVVSVVTVVSFVEALPLTLKIIGGASPFLAVVLYVARGLYLDHVNRETEARMIAKENWKEKANVRLENRKHGQNLEILTLRLEHERELERIKAGFAGSSPAAGEGLPVAGEGSPTLDGGSPGEGYSDERSTEYDQLIDRVRRNSVNKPFSIDQFQAWTGRQKTAAYDILKYGKQTGQIHQRGRGRYIANGTGL